VLVLDEPMTQERLLGLYLACDAYVSTDRANGWGMPCHEMMALGKPAATIDWSGSTEFMNERNSFLNRSTGRLEPVAAALRQTRPLYAGHQWAEVSVGEVRRVLRRIYEDAAARAQIGAQARRDVEEYYSLERIAWKMQELLAQPVVGADAAHAPGQLGNVPEPGRIPGELQHRLGVAALEQGRVDEAVELLGASLASEETSERWNDWAIAQLKLRWRCRAGASPRAGA
jgi:hypothetical protein